MRPGSTPASSTASLAAATPKGTQRETCCRSLTSTYAVSSKPATSPAICTCKPEGSKRVMRRTPLWPCLVASQNCSRPIPFGLTAPMPVITARCLTEAILPFPNRQYRLKVMFAANESRSRPGLRHALAGIHAGVLGALAMLGCLMLGSLWDHRSVWLVPNLFASTFFGTDAYRNELARTSWSGLALMVFVYGILGALWGLIWRDKRSPWIAFYGIIAGLAVYFLLYDFLWKHVNPLVTLYAPDRQLQFGHALWGLILARSPHYSRQMAGSVASAMAGAQPAAHEPVQEISSGEAIR